jgi:hypothetical protein
MAPLSEISSNEPFLRNFFLCSIYFLIFTGSFIPLDVVLRAGNIGQPRTEHFGGGRQGALRAAVWPPMAAYR